MSEKNANIYVRKPYIVTAHQWDGSEESASQLSKLFPGIVVFDYHGLSKKFQGIFVHSGVGRFGLEEVRHHEWIVVRANHGVEVWSDAGFTHNFESTSVKKGVTDETT